MKPDPIRGAAGCVALLLALLVTACGDTGDKDDEPGGAANSIDKGFKIGLLLPESKTARYEEFDRPYMEHKIKSLCPKCTVIYANANQDPNVQQQQVDSMLTNGAKVLIIDAVEAKAIAAAVAEAKNQGVPVVAYDRLAGGPVDAYVSFDNKQVGKLQGQALLDALKKGGDPKRGPIVMINGAPADPNAGEVRIGALSVLEGQAVIGKSYDTPGWSADQAYVEVKGAITALGADKIIGVYSANDGMAGGAARAMANSGVRKDTPLTGQDAELAAIQRILLGTQTMTVYKALKPEAEAAGQLAVDLGAGRKVTGTTTVSNGTALSIPAQLLTPVVVTTDNIKDTVVKDGYWTVSEICTSAVVTACNAAGLT